MPNSLNNCVIEHKQYVPCASFKEKMCTNQDISNIPFIMRGNHFLVNGHKKDLPHITAILHRISLLRLLPKSYFKISSFNPMCCTLAPLNTMCLQMKADSFIFY